MAGTEAGGRAAARSKQRGRGRSPRPPAGSGEPEPTRPRGRLPRLAPSAPAGRRHGADAHALLWARRRGRRRWGRQPQAGPPAPAARLWLCGPLRLGVLGSCGEDEGLRALPGTRSVFGKWRLLLFMTLIAEEREPRRQNVLGPVRGPVDDPGLGGQTLGWGFTKAGTGDGQHAAGRGRRSRGCGGGTQGPQGPDEAAELRFKGIGRTPGRRQPREPGRQGPGSCEEAGRNAAPHLQSPESRE